MKTSRSTLASRNNKKGFTAVELGAVIAGALLFVAVATFGILRALDNNRYSALAQTAGVDVPAALMNIYSTTGTLTSLSTTGGKAILTGMGIKPNTEWNTAWTVQTAGTGTTVTLRFPLGGGQAATKGPTMQASLPTQFPIISAAAFTSPNLDLTYNLQN